MKASVSGMPLWRSAPNKAPSVAMRIWRLVVMLRACRCACHCSASSKTRVVEFFNCSLGPFGNFCSSIYKRLRVEHIARRPTLEQTEEIDAVLGWGTLKPGKMLSAELGRISILALMASPRIIHREVLRYLKTHLQNQGFLLMEALFTFVEYPLDLPRRDVHAPLSQLL